MSPDEVVSAMERLKEGDREEYKSDPKGAIRKTNLKPSRLNPGQYELAFPAKKSARQSERLKSRRERVFRILSGKEYKIQEMPVNVDNNEFYISLLIWMEQLILLRSFHLFFSRIEPTELKSLGVGRAKEKMWGRAETDLVHGVIVGASYEKLPNEFILNTKQSDAVVEKVVLKNYTYPSIESFTEVIIGQILKERRNRDSLQSLIILGRSFPAPPEFPDETKSVDTSMARTRYSGEN